ncbi:Protein phosphatase 2C family protein [Perilla frutescens var. hirtella]|nr:Protein phosphatase 2C family protein [Perilla frutescens var. frutescens]KAH6800913.1 Protein phosphatase 2C family protein [Perilla frutescens var. hirtella]
MKNKTCWKEPPQGKSEVETTTLQHLSSVPNRIITNERSSNSCIFIQQGRKCINQDAMIVWEDFMAEDVTLCGVFDSHGPHGSVAYKSFQESCQADFKELKLPFQDGRFRIEDAPFEDGDQEEKRSLGRDFLWELERV